MHAYRYLINILLECARACEHCSASCLGEKDMHHLVNCIKLNRECADICILTSRLLERDSQLSNDIVDLCIQSTRLCAAECEKFGQYNYCKVCAEACRKAEKAGVACL